MTSLKPPTKVTADLTISTTSIEALHKKSMELFWLLSQTVFLLANIVLVYYCLYMMVHLLAITYG